MNRITPFLWFDGRLEEAVQFYTSVFASARVHSQGPMMASFELEGQQFLALNGGPSHKFSPAVSFFVRCETQAEIDDYWSKLTAGGGKEGVCGWLEDKFGLSWQVVPAELGRLMGDEDREKSGRVAAAMMRMKKLDLEALVAAHRGEAH
jgi:predicted 3-demethylubiquinone-9 3-methyltransferase (glyoxalase superfamily)